jgi:Kdo2-lipid IVA lauroyltransferase/acyltransferase
MLRIVYALFTFYYWLIRCMPLRLVYGMSGALGRMLYRVLRYRRKVVRDNLLRSFPEKDLQWIRRTERAFYRNLADVFHEMMHFSRYDADALLQRIIFENTEAIREYVSQGRSICIMAGHCGNWELMGLTLPLATGLKTFGAARRQSDPFFDKKINALRSRFGLTIVPSERIYRALLHESGEPVQAYLIADQSPPKQSLDHWCRFLHQETPVFRGGEVIARKLGMVVFFARMERMQRGRYRVTFDLLSDDPGSLPEGGLANIYMEALEKLIIHDPAAWLWSHKRWKHKKAPDRLP